MTSEELPEDGEKEDVETKRSSPPRSGITPEDGLVEAEPVSPYRNLLFPLVVVPAMIVVVALLLYTLVGAITGKELTLDENLDRVLHGGSKEREHATYALVAQLVDNHRALVDGEEPPWEISDELAPNLVGALDGLGEDEAKLLYVLSAALHNLGDPAGLEGLRKILTFGEEADPGGELKFNAISCLGVRGDPETFGDVKAFLESEDHALRIVAAGCLRFFPKEQAAPALKGSLGDLDLAVRLNAAISLSFFNDPSGATLLRDGAKRDIYEAERARNPLNYARAELVRKNRVQALEGLGRLARAEDRDLLEELAEGDEDLEVREAAMRALNSEK